MRRCRIICNGKFALALILLLVLAGCKQKSEKESDSAAGLNGGFEISKNSLPVNWLMYTPNTVPDAEFDIVLDTINFREGKQSLRFDVGRCSSVGGWHSPGFSSEFYELGKFNGPAKYKLSFWIRNKEAKFRITAGGVTANEGHMKILIESNEKIKEWKYFEYHIDVPTKSHLRMELNILAPGRLWIDDVQIMSI